MADVGRIDGWRNDSPKVDSPCQFQSLLRKQASVLHHSGNDAVPKHCTAQCLLTTPSFLSTAPGSSNACVEVVWKGRPPAGTPDIQPRSFGRREAFATR